MKTVSVIGAGFAGLTVSLRLAQKGFKVHLYEASSNVGGLLGTDITEHGLAERAANTFIRNASSERFFSELNITPTPVLKFSKKRFIYRERPQRWPLSLIETAAFLCKFLPKFFFSRESLKPHPGQTLQAWGHEHLGNPPTEFLLGPAMQGVYGSDLSQLSASLILSPLFQKNRKKYKGLLAAPQGMQEILDRLESKLKNLNVQIHTNSRVALKDLNGLIVIATSAKSAADLLAEDYPSASHLLSPINMLSLTTVTLFFKNPQNKFHGFGCLIPHRYGFKTLGILMNSFIFEGRQKNYNETWILENLDKTSTDQEILQLIAEERFKVLDSREGILDYRIHRWPEALPRYDLNLEKALRELRRFELPSQMFLHGNYLEGIGLSKILERSGILAEEIARLHG